MATELKDIRLQDYGVGDTIAYASYNYNAAALTVGVVTAIVQLEHPWRKNETRTKLKVDVTHSSSYAKVPRKVTIECLDRVVKI